MANLKIIKKRISAVSSTKKLTRAMKMIAAARLKKAQNAAVSARGYNNELKRILTEIIEKGGSLNHPLLQIREENNNVIDLFVFTSDKGLCGSFNERVLKEVNKFVESKRAEGTNVVIKVFGKKGSSSLKKRDVEIEKDFINIPDDVALQTASFEVKAYIDKFKSGATKEVYIVYNSFKNVGSAEVTFSRLLPAALPNIEDKYGVDYIYEPNREGVIGWLVAEIVKTNMYQAYLESRASELAARMVAMEMATKNAESLISLLTMQFNRARQAAITKELMDIVGGAEAMK